MSGYGLSAKFIFTKIFLHIHIYIHIYIILCITGASEDHAEHMLNTLNVSKNKNLNKRLQFQKY